MSVNSKMTALADEIRELSGTTTTKSIDAMTSDVITVNSEIAEQTELLEQIAAALEGKVASAGGLNIAFGDTAPSDTSKLWIKGNQGNTIAKTNIKFTLNATPVATFPVHLYEAAFASFGEYVYIFGGANKTTNKLSNTIYRYNLLTHTTATLTPNGTSVPYLYGAAASTSNGKIYIFGGSNGTSDQNYIYCYTIETNTLTKLSATMPKAMESITAQTVGTNIYLFGGSTNGTRNDIIYKFDTTNDTIASTSKTIYTPAFGLSSAKLPNDKIFICGGYDNFKDMFCCSTYNPTSNQCYLTMNCLLVPNSRSVANGYMVFTSCASGTYLTNAYAGISNYYSVSYNAHLGHIALYNNKVYSISSYTSQNVVEFEETFALKHGTYCIELGNAEHEVKLYSDASTTVFRVFVGDADGKARLAEAYVYNKTKQKWINIVTYEEYN